MRARRLLARLGPLDLVLLAGIAAGLAWLSLTHLVGVRPAAAVMLTALAAVITYAALAGPIFEIRERSEPMGPLTTAPPTAAAPTSTATSGPASEPLAETIEVIRLPVGPSGSDAAREASIRREVLDIASWVTTGRDRAQRVLDNAVPLLEWLAEADTRAELEARHAALARQARNTVERKPGAVYKPDNDTGALLRGAQTLLPALRSTPSESATTAAPGGR